MKTKIIIFTIGMIFLIWIILASAKTPEQELLELEQELTDAGFEWLKWAGGLVGCGLVGCGLWDGGLPPTPYFLPAYIWDAFDLRVVGGYVEKIPNGVLKKKLKLDKIRAQSIKEREDLYVL